MSVALDSSVLIAWEKAGGLPDFLEQMEGPFYVPTHAAVEFLLGTHPPVRAELRERARQLYDAHIREMVDTFEEADAAQLAALASELRSTGQQMKFYDAAIAATVIARGDQLLSLDSDFDRLKDKIELLKFPG
jgi:predicted nucleic acid-binding protein